jgi:long-subunit fatty acid transport protein
MSDYTSVVDFKGFNGGNSLVQSLAPLTDLYTMSLDDERTFLDSNIPFQVWLADTSDGYFFPVVTDSVSQSGLVLEGGGMNHWSFGGGVEVAKNLSVGISLNLVSGRYSYDREFIERDARNVYSSNYAFPYNFDEFMFVSTIESRLSGFNALLGMSMRKPGRYQVGLALRTPTTYEVTETFSDQGTSRFDDGSTYSSGYTSSTSYRVITPSVVSGGLSLTVFDGLTLMGDAEYTDWTEIQFDTDHPDLLQENRYMKRAFRATTNLRGGAEVTFWDWGIVLRGGMAYLPSPYKDDPTSFDQKYITGGVGFELDRNTMLNVSGARGVWKSFRDNYYIDGLIQPSSTQENVTTTKVMVTLAYRF